MADGLLRVYIAISTAFQSFPALQAFCGKIINARSFLYARVLYGSLNFTEVHYTTIRFCLVLVIFKNLLLMGGIKLFVHRHHQLSV